MKAIVMTRFGPPEVLQLRDVPKPAPTDHEILVKVHATTASTGDCELRGLRLPFAYRLPTRLYLGLRRGGPVILGQEFAGEIEAVGAAVTRFKGGDRVFGWTGFGLGGYAEYACLPETGVVATIPSTVSYGEAAPLAVGGLEAVHFLRGDTVRSGDKMLIIGAGGSIGTFAVQLAKHLGALVTAVDSAGKLDMLRSIGADRVIDFTREDYTSSGETYDVILDVVGKGSFSRTLRLLSDGGRYLMGNPRLSHRVRGRWASRGGRKRIIPWASKTPSEHADDLEAIRGLVGAGTIRTVIDRSYPLERTADAHRYVDSGQKKGNVVITVSPRTEA